MRHLPSSPTGLRSRITVKSTTAGWHSFSDAAKVRALSASSESRTRSISSATTVRRPPEPGQKTHAVVQSSDVPHTLSHSMTYWGTDSLCILR